MKKWMIILGLFTGFSACSDDESPDPDRPEDSYRVTEINGKNAHWGVYTMKMTYHLDMLDSVLVLNEIHDTIAVMSTSQSGNTTTYSLMDIIPNIDADSIRKLYEKYGEDAKDSIPMVDRKLFSMSSEWNKEKLIAQTFSYFLPPDDPGSGVDFDNKYLNDRRMRYLYEYDGSGELFICRVFEDIYDKEKNEEYSRKLFKYKAERETGLIRNISLYQGDDRYGTGENYLLKDTYIFSYTGELLIAVSGSDLYLEYTYSGENPVAVKTGTEERKYSYDSHGNLIRIEQEEGDYMDVKYERGYGDFHLFTPLLERLFRMPVIR